MFRASGSCFLQKSCMKYSPQLFPIVKKFRFCLAGCISCMFKEDKARCDQANSEIRKIMNGIVSILVATPAYLDFELRAMAATYLAVPGLVKKPKIQIKNMRWNAIKSTSVKPRQCNSSPLSPRTSRNITWHQHNRCKTLNGRHFCCADAPVCAPEALEASHPSLLSFRPFDPKIAHPHASTGIVTSFVLMAS